MQRFFIINNLSFAGYLLDYALAPYVGYPSAAYFAGYSYTGISFFGTSGQ